jgi:hypothetical protein
MKADASRRLAPPPPGALPMIPFLLPLAVPYYLFATRSLWQGEISSILGILFIVADVLHGNR